MKVKLSYFLLTVFLIGLIGCSSPQVPPNPLPVSKEATCIEGIAGRNYKYLAWGIGDDNELAERDALKAALWVALIGGGAGNCVALMSSSERINNEGFIKEFFANDDEWSRYVRSSNQGRIDADKRLKLESGKIKLGIEAIVDTKMLREDLEAKGIIGGMKIK